MKYAILTLILMLAIPAFAATDIKNDATLGTNLVSCWEFDEASGTRNDSKGTNHLTATNNPVSGTGIQGNAADFEQSSSQYLSITDGSQTGLNPSGSMTLSTWVNLETALSSQGMIMAMKWNGLTQRAYSFELAHTGGNDYYRAGFSNDGSTQTAANRNFLSNLSTGTWYHLVMRYNASGGWFQIWRNGVLQGTNSGMATSVFDNTAAFYINGIDGGTAWGDGRQDVVAFWNTALSTSSITDLYNGGTGIPCVSTSPVRYGEPVILFE